MRLLLALCLAFSFAAAAQAHTSTLLVRPHIRVKPPHPAETKYDLRVPIGALGLEKAVQFENMHCTMTAAYDKWVRCGDEIIQLQYYRRLIFKGVLKYCPNLNDKRCDP
jgi:hypothetical protein